MQTSDSENETLELDYFVGGVPALLVFTGAMEDLVRILESGGPSATMQRLCELCFVGALSYFEAFCKDHFASILNIAPQLISKLSQAGIETRVDPMQILQARDGLRTQIGFLVTERMDLGTADQVNKLYGHILRLTPFSKDNRARFVAILRDRNLLVHHGGVYTSGYIKQKSSLRADRSRAYLDSKITNCAEVLEVINFLRVIAIALAKSSKSSLREVVKEMDNVSSSIEKAVDYLDFMMD